MTEPRTDVTDRATALGWTLPKGWSVLAWLEPDDDVAYPSEWGDAYLTDVDEADYKNPTRAYCAYCGAWIRKLDGDTVTGVGPDADGRDPEPGDWADLATGIDCPGQTSRHHHPGEPMTVRWWREDRWRFVGVRVAVVDPDDREWSIADLWRTEAGTFPYKIDRETGAITSKEIDPLTEDYPLCELIPQALDEAQAALAKLIEQAPVITAPAGGER